MNTRFSDHMKHRYLLVFCNGLLCIWLAACSVPARITATQGPQMVSELTRDWLRFNVYTIPQSLTQQHHSRKSGTSQIIFSIRITNMKDNASPLRKICGDLEQYNTYYEYLLNQCKDQLSLQSGNEIAYPVYYAFENNYNSFPFETINVGYRFKARRDGLENARLVFIDRVFTHDTLRFTLNNIKI